MANEDLAIENAKQSEQIKTLFSTIDKIEKRLDGVEKIASSVEKMASTTETLAENMKEMKADIAEIKKEPANNAKDLKKATINTIVGVIVGGLAAALLALIIK